MKKKGIYQQDLTGKDEVARDWHARVGIRKRKKKEKKLRIFQGSHQWDQKQKVIRKE